MSFKDHLKIKSHSKILHQKYSTTVQINKTKIAIQKVMKMTNSVLYKISGNSILLSFKENGVI